MTQAQRQTLINRYADGYAQVADALAGFPPERMADQPLPGKWSAREIVHHLGDSESTSAMRIRRMLAEDAAVIQGYDQDVWATRLRYNERDHAAALELFRAARAVTTPLLNSLSDADWASRGTHSESGAYSAEHWLEIYAGHAHGHADQIRRLRDALR